MSAPTPLREAIPVEIRDIEKSLNQQLKAAQAPGEGPIVRARMSNLIIYTESAAKAAEIEEQIPSLAAVHPARVILLVHERGHDSPELTASTRTGVTRVGTGLRAFSETIILRADGDAGRHLPFAVRELLIGDLPTNIWWAVERPPSMAGEAQQQFADHADQLVYDSYGWPEPAKGMAATSSWLERFERPAHHRRRRRVASDLTWRRLKTWRSLIAQALDPASTPHSPPESVGEVVVDHGPHSVLHAWTLASWLSLVLGWVVQSVEVRPNEEIHWRLSAGGSPRQIRIRRFADLPRGISRVNLACSLDGTPGSLELKCEGPRRLSITPMGIDASPRTVAIPDASMVELLGRQLSDREADPVFRQSMAVAQSLAQSVLG